MTLLRASLLLPALVASAAFAQAPQIHFESTHYDFGKIPQDRQVSTKYKVTNTGNAVLSITNVRAACGCTSTVTGSWSIKPGESTEIAANFNPKGQKGLVRKSITVDSNDPKTPVTTLTFEADVVTPIQASKDNLFFDNVPRGGSVSDRVTLTSFNGQPVKIDKAEALGAPYLHLDMKPEGNNVVLEMTLDGRQVPKDQSDGVEVVTLKTASAEMPVLRINVQWQIKPAVLAVPATVAWAESPQGAEQRMKLVLKQAEGKPFKVTNASSTNPLVKVEGVGQAAAPQQELWVVLAAGARPGRYAERVTIFTDSAESPEIGLPVYALVK